MGTSLLCTDWRSDHRDLHYSFVSPRNLFNLCTRSQTRKVGKILTAPMWKIRTLIFSIIFLQQFVVAEEKPKWDTTKPRGKTRVIDFTTTEGTKMSLDLSPDGKWITFDLLAHIYRVPASGGQAECLTQDSGIAVNFEPRFSPDGKSIAFISDRKGQQNLWIMDADGKNPRVVFTDDNACVLDQAWTPDSKYIIVRKQKACHRGYGTSQGLWMYHKDGGTGIQILKEKGASWPSVDPNGKTVYYQALTCSTKPISQSDSLQGCQQIQRLRLDNGTIEAITHGVADQQVRGSSGGAIAPQISPDGKYLA